MKARTRPHRCAMMRCNAYVPAKLVGRGVPGAFTVRHQIAHSESVADGDQVFVQVDTWQMKVVL
jgi:hypothetical protein